MKIRPVGAELLHADRQTDRQTDTTRLIVAFRNIANAYINDRNEAVILTYLLAKWPIKHKSKHPQTCYFFFC